MASVESNFLKEFQESLALRGHSELYKSIGRQQFLNSPFKTEVEKLPQGYKRKALLISETGDDVNFILQIKYLNSNMIISIPNVNSSTKVEDLKQYILKNLSIPIDNQRILLKGRPLGDMKTIKELNIDSNTLLHLQKKQNTANVVEPTENDQNEKSLSENVKGQLNKQEFWDKLELKLENELLNQPEKHELKLILDKWKRATMQL